MEFLKTNVFWVLGALGMSEEYQGDPFREVLQGQF